MASATFTINTTSVPCAKSVAYGGSVALALSSTVGVRTITWSIAGSSRSTLTNPTITPAGNPSGATASCTHVADPGDGAGAAFLVRCSVTDDAGVVDTRYGVFGTINGAGLIPACAGEQLARSATHGWLECINTPATNPPSPISHTSGIGITLASVSDPGSAPSAGRVRIRSKTDATDGDLLMAETSTTDARILTSPRKISGITVTELGDTGTTTDNTTWTTILTIPDVVSLPAEYYYVDGYVLCDSYDPAAPPLAAHYKVITRPSGFDYLQTEVSGLVLNTDFRATSSVNDLLIQVKGPAVATHTWIARATVDVRS